MLRLPSQDPAHPWGEPPLPGEVEPWAFLPDELAQRLRQQVREAKTAADTTTVPWTAAHPDAPLALISDAACPHVRVDRQALHADPSVALPLTLLQALCDQGLTGPSAGGWNLESVDDPESIVGQLLAVGSGRALLAPTAPQSVAALAVLARLLEQCGVATVMFMPWWPLARLYGLPRTATAFLPPGRPFGDAGWYLGRRQLLLGAISAFERCTAAGHILHLPWRWPWPVRQDFLH